MISSTAAITAVLHQQQVTAIGKDAISMPWPSINPPHTVPFFDRETYKAVNLNAPASEQNDGLDLPFNDIPTLRFFFNLGVQQSRAILLSQLHEKLAIGRSNQPSECSQRSSSNESITASTDSLQFSWPCSALMNAPCGKLPESRDVTKFA